MKKLFSLLSLWLMLTVAGLSQSSGSITVTDGTYTCYNCRTLVFSSITVSGNKATIAGGGGGSGTVTSISVVTANGVSASCATCTTTPALTFVLGAITPTTVNGLTITPTTSGVLTIANSKTLTASNTLTFTGTDGSSVAFGAGGTVSYATGANPTASVGLSAVNGVASTFMRSDAAPALSQSITPTWTGPHTWSPSANATPVTISGYSLTGSNASSMVSLSGTINTTGSPDIFRFSVVDTARGANTKLFNFYGGAAGTTSLFALNNSGTELAFNASGVVIRNNGASGIGLRAGNTTINLNNAFLTLGVGGAATDFILQGGIRLADANAYDVILSAADAWNLSTNRNGGNLRLTPGAPSGSGSRGKVIFGLADSATPLAVTLGVSGATGSNVAGVDWTWIASQSTGNANGGSIIFQTTPSGSSGSSQNTPVTAFVIAPDGVIYPKPYTFTNLPTPVNGDGGMVFCSDCTIASPCASGGTGAMAKRLNGAWVCN